MTSQSRSYMLLLSFLVIAAGASLAFQQILNANLRTHLGSPWWAGTVSYFVGLAFMLALALLWPGPRPTQAAISGTPWLLWLGGLFGAVYIGMGIFAVPKLGVARVLALVVVGQMLGSMIFDHFGLFGLPQHPVTWQRLAGAVLLIAGVMLVKS